jgi:hypothetical protein
MEKPDYKRRGPGQKDFYRKIIGGAQLLEWINCLNLCIQHTVLKKIAAIFLIAILSFNWYGYRIVMNIMAKSADQRLEARLDSNDYDEAQLIELKVPLNMPYQNQQSEFERHYGEIEINGKYYTYVKRKVENGFLVLKCISNSSKQSIESAGTDYFKMTNGLGQPDKKQQDSNKNFAKNFWSEYDGRETDFSVSDLADLSGKEYFARQSSLTNIILPVPGQPPESARL